MHNFDSIESSRPKVRVCVPHCARCERSLARRSCLTVLDPEHLPALVCARCVAEVLEQAEPEDRL
jgi:hypothetical protein